MHKTFSDDDVEWLLPTLMLSVKQSKTILNYTKDFWENFLGPAWNLYKINQLASLSIFVQSHTWQSVRLQRFVGSSNEKLVGTLLKCIPIKLTVEKRIEQVNQVP